VVVGLVVLAAIAVWVLRRHRRESRQGA
jgi:hypothetical protein